MIAEDESWQALLAMDHQVGIELKMSRLLFPQDGSGPHIHGIKHVIEEVVPEDWRVMVGLPKLLGMTDEALEVWISVLQDYDLDLAVCHGGDTVGFDWMLDDPERRYTSPIDSTQYRQVMERAVAIGRQITDAGIPLGIENTAMTQFYQVKGKWLPITFCCPRIGMFPGDTNFFCQQTEAVPVIDTEHGSFDINWLLCLADYWTRGVWKSVATATNFFTDDDRFCLANFGFALHQGEVPFIDHSFFGMIDAGISESSTGLMQFLSKFENLGHFQLGSSPQEVTGGNITSHSLISEYDNRFRGIVRQVLKLEPKSLMVEAGLDPFGRFDPEILDVSIHAFGKILLEEIERP